MQSPGDLSDDNIAISPRQPLKRRLYEDLQTSAISGSSSTPQPSAAPSNTLLTNGKRLKTTHSAGNIGNFAGMSKVLGIGARSKVIDLTRPPSNFQPHTGVKRLVIKNLRTSSTKGVDEYYDRTWAELDVALTTLFNKVPPATPLEVLCRGVEATCRRGLANKLYLHLKDRCKSYLEKQLLPELEKQSGTGNVDALRAVQRFWTAWNEQSTLLRSIFSYLDRSYLLTAKELPQLEDLSIAQYRHAIFSKTKGAGPRNLGAKVVLGMCDLVQYSRATQEDLFDAILLKDSILMVHIFGVYGKSFEPEFLEQSARYFETFALDHSSSSLKDYISAVHSLLAREALRVDAYNFDSTTKRSLLDSAHRILIEDKAATLLDPRGLATLIEENALESMKSLYGLLTLSKIQKKLKEPFEEYIKAAGAAIVRDKDKVDEMVVRLLELKKSLDVIIRDAFEKDEAFSYSLREAFGNFINDKKNTLAYGTNNSKVGEMIAKYMDSLLRGGLKAVPRSLASDAKDRDTAEKQGVASTGDEDAELDRQLEQGLELFRFIEGKDVFEAFYKKDLARRLLMARSASQDAERNMLAKLKVECGFTFTHNLEQMFKDQEIARDEMIGYKQSLSNTSTTTMDLQVSVLSAAAWPTYPDVTVKLPSEVAKNLERYELHYKHKHTGRRLTWKHALAHSVVKAKFKRGAKELLVSAFQAIVLVLFNDIEEGGNLSYKAIQDATGLIDAELERTMQSLACAKFKVLTKHPKGRDIDHDDTFAVNLGFTDPKYRIKINQIQLKETKEENKETHERVHQDRQYETQAAIVRIMKSRKTITHSNLIAEVIEQTKKRGAIELGDIKQNIDKLIDKDYMERDGSTYVYVA